MKVLLGVFCVVITLFFFIESGLAIKCYVCNSYFQQDCKDYFVNKTHNLQDCGDDYKMCRKMVHEVYDTINKEWNVRYVRQCAKTGEVGDDEGRVCKDRAGTFRVKSRYCHCNNQEGCNGASTVKIPAILTLVPLLTTLGLFLSKHL